MQNENATASWLEFLRTLDFGVRTHYCYNMIIQTKVRRIGNSLGIVLPKEALQALCVKEGQSVYLTEAAANSLRVTADQPYFDQTMAAAEAGMMKYRNALRELAK